MSTIQLQLLGHFQLRRDGEVVTSLAQGRLQSLLAYLALHGDAPQARQHLAFLFWPDSSESQARTNLRRLLHELRVALPDIDQYLSIQRGWVQSRPEAFLNVDVSEFEEYLAKAGRLFQREEREQAIELIEQAVDLYNGPFLRDCYDEWALNRRALLGESYAIALERLIALHEEQRNYKVATAYAHRLLRHDPLAEGTYQHLMRLHALNGDRTGALRLYYECAAMLARELGVEPSPETRLAHAQLLNADATAVLPVQERARGAHSQKLVGRQKEWQALLLAWEEARHGHARVVVLSGEAGIGKTRLSEEFATWLQRQGIRCAGSRAYEAQGALAFAPIIELLRSETIRPQIAQLSEIWLAPVARLLPELRERISPSLQADAATDPSQRQHFYEALARAILADRRPLLLHFDDMQWCDRETLEWLRYLLHFAPQAPLLLVMSVRSGEVTGEQPLHNFMLMLKGQQLLAEITLARLTLEETALLAAQTAGRPVAAEQNALLYEQTEGNPFFVVEMVRAAIAARSAGEVDAPETKQFVGAREKWSSPLALPDRVQAVLLARLNQLTTQAQEIAQLAASFGRSFTLEALAHAGGYHEDELVRSLDELWQRHIVAEQGAIEYDFSHPLLRAVAYRQISPMRRRVFHRRIAHSLEALHGEELDSVSGLMAIHYELAGDGRHAFDAYRRAAHFAKQAYAYIETATMLQKAVALWESLPKSQRSDNHLIELNLELGWALMMAHGWMNQEAQQAYSRALALGAASQRSNEEALAGKIETDPEQAALNGLDTRMFEAVWGLVHIYLFQGNRQKAIESSELCWSMASRSKNPEILLQAHHALWGLYSFYNVVAKPLQAVLEHAEKAIELYSPQWYRSHLLRFGGHDSASCAYRHKARAQWLLGYPNQALATIDKGVALTKELQHPFSLKVALTQAAAIHCFRGEATATLESVEEALQVSNEQFTHGHNMDRHMLRAWALAQQGQAAEVVVLAQEACSRRLAEGALMEMPFFLALLAEIYELAGQIEGAQAAIQQAFTVAAHTQQDYWLSEVHRLTGRYRSVAGDHEAAQSSFLRAVELARIQEAKSLELRAALSLSRFWAQQGQRAEAYALLAGIYKWFSEGFETADLRDAQTLLQTLTPSQRVLSP